MRSTSFSFRSASICTEHSGPVDNRQLARQVCGSRAGVCVCVPCPVSRECQQLLAGPLPLAVRWLEPPVARGAAETKARGESVPWPSQHGRRRRWPGPQAGLDLPRGRIAGTTAQQGARGRVLEAAAMRGQESAAAIHWQLQWEPRAGQPRATAEARLMCRLNHGVPVLRGLQRAVKSGSEKHAQASRYRV